VKLDRIYNSKIWILYKDIHRKLIQFLAYLRALVTRMNQIQHLSNHLSYTATLNLLQFSAPRRLLPDHSNYKRLK
jgi:hypothetical protein